VRRIASESLKWLWPRSREILLSLLDESDGRVLTAVLDSIPQEDGEALKAMHGYIQSEVANLRFVRSLIDALPCKGPVSLLLMDTLKYREGKSEGRLIKAVGLFGNQSALKLIRKSLNAGDAVTRAAALEALETLGDRKIIKDVLPILDRGGVFTKSDDQLPVTTAMQMLLAADDSWLRAIATRAIPEMGLSNPILKLEKFKSDKDALVRQAAHDAFSQMEDTRMKTLKTLSTLDRILLLRDVPMFAGLSPEDLEKIAEVAQEQFYPVGGIICEEGEEGNTLYIIVNGEVEVIKAAGDHHHHLAVRKSGNFVGEMAILESAPRSATLRALSEVRILSIEGDAFNNILLDRPEVAIAVLRNMSARVRELNEKVGTHG